MTLVDEISVTWTLRGEPGSGRGMALATTISDKSPAVEDWKIGRWEEGGEWGWGESSAMMDKMRVVDCGEKGGG